MWLPMPSPPTMPATRLMIMDGPGNALPVVYGQTNSFAPQPIHRQGGRDDDGQDGLPALKMSPWRGVQLVRAAGAAPTMD